MERTTRPLAVYYEHPDWHRPLFAELDRRGLPYEKVHADRHLYDPSRLDPPWSVLLNRMSPSAYLRGHERSIFHTQAFLGHLARCGVRVINGARAWRTELSKAEQISLLAALGLPHPATRVIHRAADAPAAAGELRYPVVVKPNVGGSGAGIRLFTDPEALLLAAEDGTLDLGIDHTALVQEYLPVAGGRIVRVEVLDGRYLYGIRVYSSGEDFNLCPADVCQRVDGAELASAACALDAPRNGLRVEAFEPPAVAVRDVERIMEAAGIELGGVEYLIDDRDGRPSYYDVNALSNFVADAPRVVGFDPFARLVDWLERELEATADPAPAVEAAALVGRGA